MTYYRGEAIGLGEAVSLFGYTEDGFLGALNERLAAGSYDTVSDLGAVSSWAVDRVAGEDVLVALFAPYAVASYSAGTITIPVPRVALYTVVAEDLEVPWDMAFLPDGDVLVTERGGRLKRIGATPAVLEVAGVAPVGEGGLLGLVLDPLFEENGYVYLYITATAGAGMENRVERFVFADNQLVRDAVIVDGIPGARYHDGGRLLFGPDGLLYISTGDASVPELAQDIHSLAGKILRVGSGGAVEVVSYGHRNPQGIAFHADGILWSTEHGRSGILSGLDEINRIVRGGNYGWPHSQGDTYREGTVPPVLHSGDDTWAPASLEIVGDVLLFGGLRGEALYGYNLRTKELTEHFKGVFGRIRTVRYRAEEDAVYLLTSNRDGRGVVRAGDDKVIRIDAEVLLR